MEKKPEDLLNLTTEIVATFVSNNAVSVEQLPDVIKSVHQTLSGLDAAGGPGAGRQEPAVAVKKSVRPEYIVCLEDGKKLKMLKRHLRTNYNMTPEEYRAKWGLPPDYPMVAPNYAAARSEMAKRIGLGQNGRRRRED